MLFNEKWTLFLIATFVVCFGIVDSLIKKTAASEVLTDVNNIVSIHGNEEESSKGEKLTGILSYTIDNCLSSIQLSEGFIEFKNDITEYWIEVNNFEKLEVYPMLNDDTFLYTVEKHINDDNKSIIILISDQDNNFKKYIIYVNEIVSEINIE